MWSSKVYFLAALCLMTSQVRSQPPENFVEGPNGGSGVGCMVWLDDNAQPLPEDLNLEMKVGQSFTRECKNGFAFLGGLASRSFDCMATSGDWSDKEMCMPEAAQNGTSGGGGGSPPANPDSSGDSSGSGGDSSTEEQLSSIVPIAAIGSTSLLGAIALGSQGDGADPSASSSMGDTNEGASNPVPAPGAPAKSAANPGKN